MYFSKNRAAIKVVPQDVTDDVRSEKRVLVLCRARAEHLSVIRDWMLRPKDSPRAPGPWKHVDVTRDAEGCKGHLW